MPGESLIDQYRYDAEMLLSCSRRKLIRIAQKWNREARSSHIVYQGLTHEQSVTVAEMNRDDCLYVAFLKH